MKIKKIDRNILKMIELFCTKIEKIKKHLCRFCYKCLSHHFDSDFERNISDQRDI